MTDIALCLNNFNDAKTLLSIFPASDKYEFTSKKVFRLKSHVICSCGCKMVHNGYNYAQKKGFGKVRLGKQLCKHCWKEHQEEKKWWKNLLKQWYDTLKSLLLILRDADVGWEVISKIMQYLIPISKDTAHSLFNQRVEQFCYEQQNYVIVNYDEQHPKKGRCQKFRLTLLNYNTRNPIADSLFDSKDKETIIEFLRANLDISKKLIVIVDCDQRYPEIFKEIWGNKLILQKCLLHLNKLVVKDSGKARTLRRQHDLYLLLNIFYNRKAELKVLERLLKKLQRQNFASDEEKKEWEATAVAKFKEKVKLFEHQRRREKRNLKQRKEWKARDLFNQLWQQRNLLPKKLQSRLKMIGDNWKYFTAFYRVRDCPATNNAIENFFSTSLKTHRKKQLRTDKGLINHMKLAAIKRKEGFLQPKKTLLQIFSLFKLVSD